MQTRITPAPHDRVEELVERASDWRELLKQLKTSQATSSEVDLAFMLFQRKAAPVFD
jgi:hypothetical protein